MPNFHSRRLDRIAFPHRVFDLAKPPTQLFLVGELPRGPAVAVIGTRSPTDDALRYTEDLVVELAHRGVSIWSGGAEGIDIAAHRAAMRAKTTTVVVAPAGWNRPYPPEHAADYDAIVASGGAYLSIVSPDTSAQRHRFFARNELLMALVDVVVIVQAGFRSGARNAAKFARRLGRPLFVAPSCPWVHRGLGCNLEIVQGARVLLSARHVVEAIPTYGVGRVADHVSGDVFTASAEPRDRATGEAATVTGVWRSRAHTVPADMELDMELTRVLEEVRSGARHIDELCKRTGLTPAVVQSDVLRLTLLGLLYTDRAGAITPVTT